VKNFKLVNTQGLTGVFHKGRTIPLDKIDDTLAEELFGKTHVLERVPSLTGKEEPPVPEEVAALAKRKN